MLTGWEAKPGIDLPKPHKAAFKSIFTLVEEKQYKRAIKAADSILAGVVNHAESISMKGLATLNLGKKEEALELARSALKINAK